MQHDPLRYCTRGVARQNLRSRVSLLDHSLWRHDGLETSVPVEEQWKKEILYLLRGNPRKDAGTLESFRYGSHFRFSHLGLVLVIASGEPRQVRRKGYFSTLVSGWVGACIEARSGVGRTINHPCSYRLCACMC